MTELLRAISQLTTIHTMRFMLLGMLFLFVLPACNEASPPTEEEAVIVQPVASKEPVVESSSTNSLQPKEVMQQQALPKDHQVIKTHPQNVRASEAHPAVRQTSEKQESPTVPDEKQMNIEALSEPVERNIETNPHSKSSIERKHEEVQLAAASAPAPPSHAIWDALLNKYVNATGKVNYTELKNEKSKLDEYLNLLRSNPPQGSWSREEKQAYWINAYNAFTVKLIVDNYPLSSITKLHGGNPWKVSWIKIGNKTYSLDEIENSILRPQFKDARIHFAVNCAAKSCPSLLNKAWTASNLEANFERQARAFINNSTFNKLTAEEVQVSKIFEWYAEDFGNLVTYLNRYSKVKINAEARISFLEYNWSLNN